MLIPNLVFSTMMVILCVIVHFLGLAGLLKMMGHRHFHKATRASIMARSVALALIVLALFLLLSVEIWLYAAFYIAVGEFGTLEEALYFSTSTFTTVGFGDVYLDEKWRLLSAIESATGFLLIGWSTAFLVSVTANLRRIEAGLEETTRHGDPEGASDAAGDDKDDDVTNGSA